MEEAVKRFAPMMKHMYATMGELCKAFYERYGKEALPIITKVAEESGVESAKIAQEMMPVKSMKDVGELWKMYEMMGWKVDIIELSDDLIHFKTSPCPLGLEGTAKELCEAMMTSDVKMVSTLLEQEVEGEILKSVAAGDEYCEVIFSIKK